MVIILVGMVAGLVGLQVAFDGLSVLGPGLYLSALEQCGFFEDAPELFVAVFSEQASGLPSGERAKIEAAIREAASPEWMKGQVSAVVTDISRFLTGKQRELTAAIHVEEFADRFLAAYGKTANPFVFAQVRQNVSGVFAKPLSLRETLMTTPTFVAATQYVRRGLNLALIVGVSWLVLAALTFALAGGFPGGARWVGTACLVAGLAGVVGSFVAGTAAPGFTAGFNFTDIPPDAASMVQGTATAIVRGIMGAVRLNAVAVLIVGVILLIVAGVVSGARARRRPAKQLPRASRPRRWPRKARPARPLRRG